MNENITIRPLRMEDYDAVVSLWIVTDGIGLSEADSRESLSAYLARNPDMSLVAEVSGKTEGAVLCGHDGRRGYIHHLAVFYPFRGRGIGTLLVEMCIEKLRQTGIQKCHIFVYPDNEAGLRFWRRKSFVGRDDIRLCSRDL